VLGFVWAREVTPTGRGSLSKREHFGVETSLNATERLSFDGSARWTRSRDVLPAFGLQLDSVRYTHLSTGLQWRLTATLSASATFAWSRQSSAAQQQQASGRDGSAEGYRAGLGLVWNGLQRNIR